MACSCKVKREMIMKSFRYLFILLLIFPAFAFASQWNDGGLPGAFLEYGVSARVIGMGKAFTGLANDANAGYFNPGGLDQLNPKELVFQHGMLFEGTTFDYLTYAHPTSIYGTFGTSFMMVRTPDIDDRTSSNGYNGNFSENEFAWLLTMSKQLGRYISVGLNYKMIYHKISYWGAIGHGADIGFFLFPDRIFSMGIIFQNVIKPSILLKTERDIYPLTFRGGISLKLLERRLIIDSDIRWSEYQYARFYEGVEYRPWWPLILRAGVDVNQINLGLGIRKEAELWAIGIDYAFSSHYQSDGLIPPTHTVSLVVDFGGFRAKVIPSKSIFSPLAGGNDNIVWMELNVPTRAPIKRWQLRVKNSRDEIVRVYNAWGDPPARLYWDGRDNTGNLVEDGKYFYEFLVIEESGHTLFSCGNLARLQTIGPEGTVIIQEKGGVLEQKEEKATPTIEEKKNEEGKTIEKEKTTEKKKPEATSEQKPAKKTQEEGKKTEEKTGGGGK